MQLLSSSLQGLSLSLPLVKEAALEFDDTAVFWAHVGTTRLLLERTSLLLLCSALAEVELLVCLLNTLDTNWKVVELVLVLVWEQPAHW